MATRRITYLDFENGEIKEADSSDTIEQSSSGSWPIGSVFAYMSNTDPATTLGFGVWSSIGTQTIGGNTVYFFQRTD